MTSSPASTSAPDATYTAPDEAPPDTSLLEGTAQDRPCSQATAGPFSSEFALLREAWKAIGYIRGYDKGYANGQESMKAPLKLAETEREIHRGEAEVAQRTIEDQGREFRRIIRDLQADLARAQR